MCEQQEGQWARAGQPTAVWRIGKQASDQRGPFANPGKESGFYSQGSEKSLIGFKENIV